MANSNEIVAYYMVFMNYYSALKLKNTKQEFLDLAMLMKIIVQIHLVILENF